MSENPFEPLGSGGPKKADNGPPPPPAFICVMPIPPDAPPPPFDHPKLGAPSGVWTYTDAEGAALGYALRFDGPDGKQFRPLALFRAEGSTRLIWRYEAFPAPRPIFGLADLAERPGATVVVVEGEKAAEAGRRLLPDHIVITSPNGSKSAGKADWSPLKGRHVVVWPDADEPGARYAADVVRLATEADAASVAVCMLPESVAKGWDAADLEAEGGDAAGRALALIAAARPVGGAVAEPEAETTAAPSNVIQLATAKRGRGRPRKVRPGDAAPGAEGEDDGPRVRGRDALIGYLTDVTLWRDLGGTSYVTIPVGDHRENWPLQSTAFRRWLAHRAYRDSGLAPSGSALDDAMRVADALAGDGAKRDPWLRVGERDGRIYVALADDEWRVVEIRTDGWDVLTDHDCPFVRTSGMRALPAPEAGGEHDIATLLAPFTSTVEPADFSLVVAWVLGSLRPRGPYPILTLSSRQDSGKSTLTTLLRSLVDPNAAPIRAAPRDDRDLLVAAMNAHVVALDNLSGVRADLADGLCRLSTGGGFAARKLHTDNDEAILQACRPVVLNGIAALATQADLASRALVVRLRAVSDSARLAPEDFERLWDVAQPKVLGVIFDAMARGLADLGKHQFAKLPRMAGFVKFAVAALPGAGIDPADFLAAYSRNRAEISEEAFASDPVAVAIRAFVTKEHPTGWHGSATALLREIEREEFCLFSTQKSGAWPKGVAALGNRLERVAPLLETVGLTVIKRHSGERLISIIPRAPPAP